MSGTEHLLGSMVALLASDLEFTGRGFKSWSGTIAQRP